MASWLTPDVLNSIGVVTLLFIGAIAVARGWIVPGGQHRETVAAKNDTINELRTRSLADQEVMRLQAQTVSNFEVAGQLQAHVLQAIRDVAEGRAPT
jgi:uncharacterized ion transporter superfamily protein YfcC